MRRMQSFASRFTYPGPVTEFSDRVVVDYIAPKLHQGGFALVRLDADHAEFERLSRSDWTILMCVLLFPIGLLALLAPKRRDFVAFRWSAREDGTCDVTTHGQGPKKFARGMTEVRPAEMRAAVTSTAP
jgi:hypothetical protein